MNRFELVFYNFILLTVTFYKYGQASKNDIVDIFTLVHFQINDTDENTIEQAPTTTIQKLEGEYPNYKYNLIINGLHIPFDEADVSSLYLYGDRLIVDVTWNAAQEENSWFFFGIFDTVLNAQIFCTGIFDGSFSSDFERQEYGTEFTIKKVHLFVDGQNGMHELVAINPYITVETLPVEEDERIGEDNEHNSLNKTYAFQRDMAINIKLLFLVAPAKDLYLTDVIDNLKVVLYLSEKQDWKYVFYFDEPEHAQAFVNTIKDDVLKNNYLDATKIPQSLRTLIAD